MTRLEKLVERIKARPPEADFGDVVRLLEAFGYNRNDRKGATRASKSAGNEQS